MQQGESLRTCGQGLSIRPSVCRAGQPLGSEEVPAAAVALPCLSAHAAAGAEEGFHFWQLSLKFRIFQMFPFVLG